MLPETYTYSIKLTRYKYKVSVRANGTSQRKFKKTFDDENFMFSF